MCPSRARLDKAREGVPGYYTNSTDINIMTGVFGLGDIVFPTAGTEIFTRIGWRVLEASTINKTMLTTMTNGWFQSGYISDTESLTPEVFQRLGSLLYPSSGAKEKIVNSTAEYIKEYKALL